MIAFHVPSEEHTYQTVCTIQNAPLRFPNAGHSHKASSRKPLVQCSAQGWPTKETLYPGNMNR